MKDTFFAIFVIAAVVLGVLIFVGNVYIFATRCWGVPIAQMPAECALLIYTSKNP